jgi:hypothetical protein
MISNRPPRFITQTGELLHFTARETAFEAPLGNVLQVDPEHRGKTEMLQLALTFRRHAGSVRAEASTVKSLSAALLEG